MIGESEIHCLEEFPLGLLVSSSGRLDAEVDQRITNASRTFGALHQDVFKDSNHTITTKQKVYQACVLDQNAVPLYINISIDLMPSTANAFHHQCKYTVLGITNCQQWELHITSAMTCDLWSDSGTITTKRRLDWLGHVARMPDHCMPKTALYLAGHPRPAHQRTPYEVMRPGPEGPEASWCS